MTPEKISCPHDRNISVIDGKEGLGDAGPNYDFPARQQEENKNDTR
jgi:hypothetical protein